MMSHSSTQWPPLLELGALLLTAPRLWPSSCAAVWPPQQPESVRPYEGPKLLRLSWPGRSSPAKVPMPQYTLASAKIMYLRSLRFRPWAAIARLLVLKSAISASDTWMFNTEAEQSDSVTNRTCRTPPVSWALAL